MPDMNAIGALFDLDDSDALDSEGEEIGSRRSRRKAAKRRAKRAAARRIFRARIRAVQDGQGAESSPTDSPPSDGPAESDFLPSQGTAPPGEADMEASTDGESVSGSITFTYPEGFGVTVGYEIPLFSGGGHHASIHIDGLKSAMRKLGRGLKRGLRYAVNSPVIKAMAKAGAAAFPGAGIPLSVATPALKLIGDAKHGKPAAVAEIRSLETRAGAGDASAAATLNTLNRVARVRNELAVAVRHGNVLLVRSYYHRGMIAR